MDTAVVDREDADQLVARHLGLVGHLVHEVSVRLPVTVSESSLQSAALVALVHAAAAFDPDRGLPFRRVAEERIRAAVAAELRRAGTAAGGRHRSEQLDVEATAAAVSAALSRTPSVEELGEILGRTLTDLRGPARPPSDDVPFVLSGPSASGIASLGAVTAPAAGAPGYLASPAAPVVGSGAGVDGVDLRQAVDRLDEPGRTVVTRYFLDGETVDDIAAALRVSAGEVLRLRADAMRALRHAVEAPPGRRDGNGARSASRGRVTAQ